MQQTKRLLLRPMTLDDLAFFHRINNDPFVRRYLWDDEPVQLRVSRDTLRGVEEAFARHGWGLWALQTRDAGETIGYAGLWTFFGEPQPQLLYALYERHTGRGFATEAAGAITGYAFDKLGFAYLHASMDVGNASSSRVCERLGFRHLHDRDIDGKPTRFYRLRPG